MSPARVIFSTSSLCVLDIAHCFALAAEAGFDGIEVMCDERWSTRDPRYLRHLSAEYDLPTPVVHTPFSMRIDGWRHPSDQLQRIYQTLDLAENVGADAIVVHLPHRIGAVLLHTPGRTFFVPWPSPYEPVRRWMEQKLPEAQRRTHIKIAIENMPVARLWGREIDPTYWNTVEHWSAVHEYLTLDTTHWATKQIDPLDAYLAAGSRVCHVHLSNYDGREHRLPHVGLLDLGAFLRRMAADAFNGTICAELSPDALQCDDEAALRRNMRDSLMFCREHLRQDGKMKDERISYE
jgi:sugar phosphate isomerase/epimerase